MNRTELLESLQKRLDALGASKLLLSPIEGFHMLEEYEQGYDVYKQLSNPNSEDDRWAAHCSAIDSASIFESQAYLCKAIDRGNNSAKVDFAESLFWLGEFTSMQSILQTVEVNDLTAFDKTKYYCVQAVYALGNSSVAEAKQFIQKAALIANFQLQNNKMLASYFYIFDILIHSKLGRKDHLDAKLRQLSKTQQLQGSQYTQFLSVFSLVLAGHYDAALSMIEAETHVYRREDHYKNWFLGYVYWQQSKVSESVKVFEAFNSGKHPWEDTQKHLALSAFYTAHDDLKLAKANLAKAKTSALHKVDQLSISFRDCLIQHKQGSLSTEQSLDKLEHYSRSFAAMGHHHEESLAKLYKAELLRQLKHPDLKHELDDIYALSVQLENPNLIKNELSFLPELKDIASQSHSEIAGLPSLGLRDIKPIVTNTNRATNYLKLEFLGKHELSYNGTQLKLSLQQKEILVLLCLHPQGLRGETLSDLLYEDADKLQNVKVAISKLRKDISIRSRPYQLDAAIDADFLSLETFLRQGKLEEALELYKGSLLAESDLSSIIHYKEELEESVRQAVLASQNASLIARLAVILKDDLELWEAAEKLEPEASKKAFIASKVEQTKRNWNLLH